MHCKCMHVFTERFSQNHESSEEPRAMSRQCQETPKFSTLGVKHGEPHNATTPCRKTFFTPTNPVSQSHRVMQLGKELS